MMAALLAHAWCWHVFNVALAGWLTKEAQPFW